MRCREVADSKWIRNDTEHPLRLIVVGLKFLIADRPAIALVEPLPFVEVLRRKARHSACPVVG
jgi:hypothetical protein